MTRARIVAALGVLLLAVACGSSGGGGGAAPAPAASTAAAPAGGGSTVEISNFMFMPAMLTVAVGTTVTWKFDDSTDHTVTADDKSFSSPPTSGGRTFTHRFTAAGTVAYHCSIHPFMTGTIVVK